MSQRNQPVPETRLCTRCQAELPVDAPPGLCRRCSEQQELETGTWSPSSKANDPTLAPRTTEPHGLGSGTSPRYFGDYEIIEEVARGGMGVVYKARQVSLDRIVALKTILSGQLASEADVERFYAEARAAANLQHPNIVAIHEFGQHDGQQYFSMDFVEGRSLASLVETGPLPIPEAVRYLQSIAAGIHYAHQHGILHRDLKPSNILIDRFDQPRITDFGIAKRIGTKEIRRGARGRPLADSSLTTPGEVLGTPSYMSPEQIDADPAQLGPATDVYSLGAILYELLTGRPPFRGRSARDTLLAVLQAQPTSVKRLNRRTPRELERICLKCLQKDPARRYRSAAALADDLERFTLGQRTRAAAEQQAITPRILVGSLLACFLVCCGVPLILLEWFPEKLGLGQRLSVAIGSIVEQIRSSVRSSQQLQDLVRAWRPPDDSHLFPERVGAFARSAYDGNAAIPEFRIDLPGSRATYQSGPGTIEFFVFRTTRSECDRIFARVNTTFNDETVRIDANNFAHYAYKFAGQTRSGTFLRNADHLLLARTTDDSDLDAFFRAYLKGTTNSGLSGSVAANEDAKEAEEDTPVVPAHSFSLSGTATLFAVLAGAAMICAGVWRVYAKAGLPGWGCLIPFYNLVLLMRLGGKPGWWAIWLFVPLLNFVIYTIVTLEVAKNFGKGVAYTLGLLLCPPLFYAILGLGHAEYNSTLLRLRQQAAVV
jgi:serine/threonine protein kinase/ribosomal protein L40E